MKVLFLILLALPLPVKLVWDYESWKAEQHINHPKRYAVMGVLMTLVCFLVWHFGPAKYLAQVLMLSVGIFWMMFDYVINLVEGRDWWFIPDKDDPDASGTDKIYAFIGWWKLFILRVVFLSLSVSLNNWIWT